jgi:hypothetical protein
MIVIDGVEMVDVREAAQISRRTPETIRRWVWTGRLQAVKSGNKLFVRRSDLATGPGADSGEGLTLRQWASRLPMEKPGSGASAKDLVLEDRASRAGG